MAELTVAETLTSRETVAAVDLGSNSFHLIVAELRDGHLQILDRIKDMVRLAAGLDDDNRLDEVTSARALAALARFGERLRQLPSDNVRVVGTNTLRKARNADWFLREAETLLGHPIEVISGREEARLIYVGVTHSLEPSAERRLVVDIGGGSTEFVLGHRSDAIATESLYMGCVEISRRHFPAGRISERGWRAARLAALKEIEPIRTQFTREHWDVAIGSSGTVRSVQGVVTNLGLGHDGVTRAHIEQLRSMLLAQEHIEGLRLPGLPVARRDVFPGGLAILCAVFDALGIDRMHTSQGALREGLLYELVGRFDHDDVRERTVESMLRRYGIDSVHARHVDNTAAYLLVESADAWQLDAPHAAPLLSWAARLHEIGLDVAHSQYHKHGAYLLRYMDMAGFSKQDQLRLAALVRAHRRKFPLAEFQAFREPERTRMLRLAILLRLAVVLHRSRAHEAMPLLRIEARDRELRVGFPVGWLQERPLTELDLREEFEFVTSTGHRISTFEFGIASGAARSA